MAREIVLDTETTGLDPRSGHRVIEIACIEIDDYIPTGKSFHRFIDPQREIDPDAERVHGISRRMLAGKPTFDHEDVCDRFLEFVGDSPIVAHNAAFDRGFVNSELERIGRAPLPDAQWTCTYELAKSRFPGMYNSLDALCKRFKISLAEREKHGALIDTRLFAMVYLELRGGKDRALDLTITETVEETTESGSVSVGGYGARPRPLPPRSSEAERAAHAAFIAKLKGDVIWKRFADLDAG